MDNKLGEKCAPTQITGLSLMQWKIYIFFLIEPGSCSNLDNIKVISDLIPMSGHCVLMEDDPNQNRIKLSEMLCPSELT